MPRVLQHLEAGDKSSNDVIVFLQGWPDNYVLWDWINWKEDLNSKHLIFVNFPNTNGKVENKWGYDFPETILDLKFTLDSLQIADKNKVVVAHDWGCFYSYLFDQKYPKYFSQMIEMDVPAIQGFKKPKEIFFILTYQIILIIAFMLGGPIGRVITQGLVKFMKHNPPYVSRITSYQNYPYYYLYKNKLGSMLGIKERFLKGYQPSVPVSYLYGAHKPFQFHNEKWLNLVVENGGEVHKMEAGHWFMKKYGKFITDLILRRIPKL